MVYRPLLRIFENRRAKLASTLKEFDKRSQLEKQHQMYGAIQELDLVLKTVHAQALRMQVESEALSAERLINETIDLDRKRLDNAYKDVVSKQYEIDENSPFKPQ